MKVSRERWREKLTTETFVALPYLRMATGLRQGEVSSDRLDFLCIGRFPPVPFLKTLDSSAGAFLFILSSCNMDCLQVTGLYDSSTFCLQLPLGTSLAWTPRKDQVPGVLWHKVRQPEAVKIAV